METQTHNALTNKEENESFAVAMTLIRPPMSHL